MSWKVDTVMSLRKEFVALAQSDGVNMSELCRRTGISRKTGYKWLRRYRQGGEYSLHDLSKRPHSSPNQTSHELEQLIIELRNEHPAKGGHVLGRMLRDRGYEGATSTTWSALTMLSTSTLRSADILPVAGPYPRPFPASTTTLTTRCARWMSAGVYPSWEDHCVWVRPSDTRESPSGQLKPTACGTSSSQSNR